jgi:hypothetical protein
MVSISPRVETNTVPTTKLKLAPSGRSARPGQDMAVPRPAT